MLKHGLKHSLAHSVHILPKLYQWWPGGEWEQLQNITMEERGLTTTLIFVSRKLAKKKKTTP
jgi:hypothetical protein